MSASEFAAWWGAGTGTVSAVLLGARFAWDRKADGRAAKLELRRDIRAMAVGALDEMSSARAKATNGSLVGPVGDWVKKCDNTNAGLRSMAERLLGVKKNLNVLLIPNRKALWKAANTAAMNVFRAEHAWESLDIAQEFPTVSNEHKRAIAASEFLRLVGPAIDACRDLIAEVDKTAP